MFDHAPLMASVQQDLLGGDAVFPTCFQLSIAIRKALNQPTISIPEVSRLVEVEPLMASKRVHMANCVTFNPFARTVYGIEQAIHRVGFNIARSVAGSIAIEQLKMLPSMAPCARIANSTWERSVHVAALLRQLAQLEGQVNHDEALLSSLGVPEEIVIALKPAQAPWGSSSRHLQMLLLEARCIQALPEPVPPTEPRATWLQAVNHHVSELRDSL